MRNVSNCTNNTFKLCQKALSKKVEIFERETMIKGVKERCKLTPEKLMYHVMVRGKNVVTNLKMVL